MYLYITAFNEDLQSKRRKMASLYERKDKTYKEIMENKLLIFFGIMVMARIVGHCGKMWDHAHPEGVPLKLNVDKQIKKYWFDIIHQFVPYIFLN